MKIKKILSSLLAATMLFGSVTANAVTIESDDTPKRSGAAVEQESSGVSVTSNKTQHGLPADLQDGAILHAWCWSCNTIKANMKDIADAGYTAIQTSPMQQSYSRYSSYNVLMGDDVTNGTQGAWWWQYQPTAQKLGNYQFFTDPSNDTKCEQEYAAMCSEAEKYGISIITDIVSNHTTSHYVLHEVVDETTGETVLAEKPDGQIDILPEMSTAVGGYNNLWHTNAFVDKDDSSVSNVAYRTRLIDYKNGGLPDVNTENEAYQAYVVKYLNKLIELGCDGFRFDTAHRIGISTIDGVGYTYWDAVTGANAVIDFNGQTTQLGTLTNSTVSPDSLFIYGELLKPEYYSGYTKKIRITDFNYGQRVRAAVKNGSVSSGSVRQESTYLHAIKGSASNNITWVESHDDYCNNHDSCNLTASDIHLSWAILTARKAGTPLFFNRPNGSDAINGNYWGDNIAGAKGNDDFKDPEIVAVNKFRNAMAGETEILRNVNGNNQVLQIERGDKGSCIVNVGSSTVLLVGQSTNLSDGKYIDTVTNTVITVTNGTFDNGTVAGKSIACIYVPLKINAACSTPYFVGNSCQVTTTLDSRVAQGNYTINVDGQEINRGAFADGTSLTIGSDVILDTENGETAKEITLTLSANDPDHNNALFSKSFTYVKRSKKDITYVYYAPSKHPTWGDNIYCYIYKSDGNGGVIENAAWPGILLENDEASGYKRCEVPYELKDGGVIFNNNSGKQYPGSDEAPLPLSGKTMAHAGDGWIEYTVTDPDYSYVYFFNSMGWNKTKLNAYVFNDDVNNDWPGKNMTWSDELHCYYYKYDANKGYDRISFNADNSNNDKIRTDDLTLTPGKVYVLTEKGEKSGDKTFYSGIWKDHTDICSGKIYFDNSSTNWSNVYAYMTTGDFSNDKSAGEQMTFCGDNMYCLTYYYVNGHEYDHVVFSDGSSNTGSLEIPTNLSSPVIYKQGTGWSSAVPIENKTVSVTLKCFDRQVSESGQVGSVTETEATKTVTLENVTTSNLENIAAQAISQYTMNNVYDQYYFNVSQEKAVRKSASEQNVLRLGANVTYSAKYMPSYFNVRSQAYSSVNSDFDSVIQTDVQAGVKWVTYKDSLGNEILPDNVKPDLSNLSSMEIWGFNSPKIYHINMIYPKTADDFTQMKSFANDRLFVKQYSGAVEKDCCYNQLVSSAGDGLTSDMYYSSNYAFDGWYSVNFNDQGNVQSCIKVSSNKKFTYRITSDITLYAVFRSAGSDLGSPGAATIKSSSDVYTNSEGSTMYRYNTILNVYNCVDNDKQITDVGIMYVKASADDCDQNTVRTKIQGILNDSTSSTGSINISDGQSPGYVYYKYSTLNSTPPGDTKLTSKNRLQFVLNVDSSNSNYSSLMAFTVFKYGGRWIVSDNCVAYDSGNAVQKYATVN